MERRQRWLEAQFRRQDDCVSKIAKQLQVLQDFISLNFDSFRQYAVERERVDRINDLTYGKQDQGYHSPVAHSHSHHHHSRLTPIPAPDHFSSRRHHNSESEYDDGDMMDPAPEGDPSLAGDTPINPLSLMGVVDLSTERHEQMQVYQQEPNSTMTNYSTATYYGIGSRCSDVVSLSVPDSVILDDGPTDLSTDKMNKHSSISSASPPYHVSAQGSILGGILTSHLQPKIKAEVKVEEEPSQCYNQLMRSRTGSTDSISKDKEYSSQSHWGAGTMTAVLGGGGGEPDSICSVDDVPVSSEQMLNRSQNRNQMEEVLLSKSDKTQEFQHFFSDTASETSEKCESGIGKLSAGSSTSVYSSSGEYRGRRRRSREESVVTPSSTAKIPRPSPSTNTATSTSSSSGEHSTSTTTTTTRSRKNSGNSGNSASKQCRYCGKTFQWLHSVKTHERLHTGIKPYACKICGARFTQNGNLKVHAKTCVEKHADSYRSRNVFICSVCTEMFSDSDALMDHQKSHDRMQWTIKEKTCQLCGEVFQKRSFLLEHEKVHVQDKSFLSSLGIEAEAVNKSGNANNPTFNSTT